MVLTEPGQLGCLLRADSVDGPPRIHQIDKGGQLSGHAQVSCHCHCSTPSPFRLEVSYGEHTMNPLIYLA